MGRAGKAAVGVFVHGVNEIAAALQRAEEQAASMDPVMLQRVVEEADRLKCVDCAV